MVASRSREKLQAEIRSSEAEVRLVHFHSAEALSFENWSCLSYIEFHAVSNRCKKHRIAGYHIFDDVI